LHDVAEDVKFYENNENLVIQHLFNGLAKDQELMAVMVESLTILNKNRHKSYLDFVLAARDDKYALPVKIADITHNLSDLTKGSLMEKYFSVIYS